jgi:hypothetical protein
LRPAKSSVLSPGVADIFREIIADRSIRDLEASFSPNVLKARVFDE